MLRVLKPLIVLGAALVFCGSFAGSRAQQKSDGSGISDLEAGISDLEERVAELEGTVVRRKRRNSNILSFGHLVREFANNADAKRGGLKVGDVYRTRDVLKIVH